MSHAKIKQIKSIAWLGAVLFAVAISTGASAQMRIDVEGPPVPGFSNYYPWFNDVPQYEGEQSFRWFLAHHPNVSRELARNPGLLYNPNWRRQHPQLEQYFATHPQVWAMLNGDYWATGPAETQWGDYDDQHQWRDAYWWHENDPDRFYDTHPDWVSLDPRWRDHDGDYDQSHQWHYKQWWEQKDPTWVKDRHPDWLREPQNRTNQANEQHNRQQNPQQERELQTSREQQQRNGQQQQQQQQQQSEQQKQRDQNQRNEQATREQQQQQQRSEQQNQQNQRDQNQRNEQATREQQQHNAQQPAERQQEKQQQPEQSMREQPQHTAEQPARTERQPSPEKQQPDQHQAVHEEKSKPQEASADQGHQRPQAGDQSQDKHGPGNEKP